MPETMICPKGHQWEPSPKGDGSSEPQTACPVCGAEASNGASRVSSGNAVKDSFETLSMTDKPPSAPTVILPTVKGYEILGVLGRGGMGVVYKARQVKLNRLVALKMILAGEHAAPHELSRFRAEAASVARFQHANIVQIYEIGDQDGRPYFSLEFVDGGSLAKKLGGNPMAARPVAQLVETLAHAMHYAHQRGIVHRDLKPGNVLLTPDGVPKVTDFGLAKRLEDETLQTRSGAIVGTPSYMAPEQADGRIKEIGPRTDVYSLGAILYVMLTGRPPFHAETPLDTVMQVVSDEPVPPRRMQPTVPRDVETICLKCLQKDPRKRYPTAEALGQDLRRFLADEPIMARPVGRVERVWRWSRRNPMVAVLTAAVASLLIGVTVAAVYLAIRFGNLADQAMEARRQEEEERRKAEDQHKIAETERAASEAARRQLETTITDMYTTYGVTAGERGDFGQAALWFANAARFARTDPEREEINRVRTRTWGRQIITPVRALPHAKQHVTHLAFHSEGRHLMVLTDENRCTIWDLIDEKPLAWVGDAPISCAIWEPEGDWIALGRPTGEVEVRSFPDGRVMIDWDHGSPVRAFAVSPDGHYLAIGGDVARVWSSRTNGFATPEIPHPKPVFSLNFNPGCNRLATGCLDGQARVFPIPGDPKEAKPLFTANNSAAKTPGLLTPVFVDDGRELVTATARAAAGGQGDAGASDGLWLDAETGKHVRSIRFPSTQLQSVATSYGGRYFALGGYAGAQLYDANTGRTGPYLNHRNHVTSLAFSPDGRSLLTASHDRTAKLWSLSTGEPVGYPLGHQGPINAAAYAPTGRFLATGQEDGLVRVWMLPRDNPRDHRLAVHGSPTFAKLSPDGKHVIATGPGWWDGNLRKTNVHDVASGQEAGATFETNGLLKDAALSPDGQSAVTASSTAASRAERSAAVVEPDGKAGSLQFWNWKTGQKLFEPIPMPSEPRGVTYSPDGKTIVAICAGGQTFVIDALTGKVRMRLEHEAKGSAENTYPRAWFTPDGESFLTSGPDFTVRVRAVSDGKLRYPALQHGDYGQDVCFSPDHQLVVTTARDNTTRIWKLATGEPAADPLYHPDWVFTACFSPKGDHLLTACRDGNARLWNWRTGQLVCAPFKHGDEVFSAAFTPDGRWILTASRDNTARVWEWRTGKPVAPPIRLDNWAWNVLVTPNGEYAIIAGWTKAMLAVHLGDLILPESIDLEELCMIGEVLSGHRLHEGDVAGLTTDEWLQRWQEIRKRYPESCRIELELEDPIAYHRRQAAQCEQDRQWFAALVHLNYLVDARPDDVKLCSRRARVYGELEIWPNAGIDYTKAIELGADEDQVWCEHALVQLMLGKTDEYRKACAHLVERLDRTNDREAADNIARVCAAGPNAVDDYKPLLDWAQRAVAERPNTCSYYHTYGALLYRAGNFDEAIKQQKQAVRYHPPPKGGQGMSWDWLILAMAHHQLNQPKEAQDWFEKARNVRVTGVVQVLEYQLLRREATAMIKSAKPEPPKEKKE